VCAFACACVCGLQGGLTLAHILALLDQTIAGLMHLHSLGIIHRDLRAANVLVDSEDPLRVLVADLGVSHQLSAFENAGVGGAPVPGSSTASAGTVLEGRAGVGPLQVGCRLLAPWSHVMPHRGVHVQLPYAVSFSRLLGCLCSSGGWAPHGGGVFNNVPAATALWACGTMALNAFGSRPVSATR
jgi:serine/threonine protein kinase